MSKQLYITVNLNGILYKNLYRNFKLLFIKQAQKTNLLTEMHIEFSSIQFQNDKSLCYAVFELRFNNYPHCNLFCDDYKLQIPSLF